MSDVWWAHLEFGALVDVIASDAAVSPARVDLHRDDMPRGGRLEQLGEALGVAVERLAAGTTGFVKRVSPRSLPALCTARAFDARPRASRRRRPQRTSERWARPQFRNDSVIHRCALMSDERHLSPPLPSENMRVVGASGKFRLAADARSSPEAKGAE